MQRLTDKLDRQERLPSNVSRRVIQLRVAEAEPCGRCPVCGDPVFGKISIAKPADWPKNSVIMASPAGQREAERELVQNCLRGEATAWEFLRERYQSLLVSALIGRGASLTEAEDLVADLWTTCVPDESGQSRLNKFRGEAPLASWLIRVACNWFIDHKRREKFHGDLPSRGDRETPVDPFDATPDRPPIEFDETLIDLLRDCVQKAFAACTPEVLVMLRLVYMHGLPQRRLASMWGCHEATISRRLDEAMREIESRTLSQLRKLDPWLELTWDDFLALCRTQSQFL